MTLIERWKAATEPQAGGVRPAGVALDAPAPIPQGLREYNAAIAGLRLQHLITQSAVGYRRGCWAHDGTAAGHLRTLDRLCREYVRAR